MIWYFEAKSLKHFTKFFEEARIAMLTPEERFAYEESRKHYWDNLNAIACSFEKGKELGVAEGKKLGLAEGKELGLAEGKELGIAEEKHETARKMLGMGMAKDAVLQVTGLTEEELSTI